MQTLRACANLTKWHLRTFTTHYFVEIELNNTRGIESLWLVGTKTLDLVACEHFSSVNSNFAMHNFNVSILTSATNNASGLLVRMINNVVNAYNARREAPKWIVIFPDSDLLEAIRYVNYGISEAYGLVIDYLMGEYERIGKQMISNLPFKAKKFNWPYFIWIEPTLHRLYQDNNLRIKFIRSMHNAVQAHDSTVVLPLKQGWNEDNFDLYRWQKQIYTPKGLDNLWHALDTTLQFADVKLMRNYGIKFKEIFQKERIMKSTNARIHKFEVKQCRRTDLRQELTTRRTDNNNPRQNGPNRIPLQQRQVENNQAGRGNGGARKKLF